MSHVSNAVASYDLHLHTWWSYDATANPAHYLRRARERGMRCLAITEHHGLFSREDVQRAAQDYPEIQVIPAAEFTVTTSSGAVDLVCLGFRAELPAALEQLLQRYRRWQREYGQGVVAGMQALGHPFREEDHLRLLESYRPRHVLDRLGPTRIRNEVLRNHFLQRGFIAASDRYVPLIGQIEQMGFLPAYPAVCEVVPVVHAAGALVAIAHPSGYFQRDNRERMDALREECRLDGIECAHPSTPPELVPVYRRYCLEHGLLSTAGSDCHTDADADTMLGMHGGHEAWLDELLERLSSRT